MAGNFLGNCLCSLVGAGVFIAGCTIFLVTAFPIAQITIGAVYMYECPAVPFIPVYVMVCGMLGLLTMGLLALPNVLCPAAPGNKIWTLWILSLVLFAFTWFLYGSYQIYSVYPPNYDKTTVPSNRFNNSIHIPSPDHKPPPILENQNGSHPNLNQTWIFNSNQTLKSLIQMLALGNTSTEVDKEHVMASSAAMAAESYCDRTVYMFAFWTTTLIYVFGGNALVMIICLYGVMKITEKLSDFLTNMN